MAQIVTTFEERAEGRVARVVIDNAVKLNVLNSALSAELEAAFRGLVGVEGLRAVVLAGEGGQALIGGADIREMAGLTPVTAGRSSPSCTTCVARSGRCRCR